MNRTNSAGENPLGHYPNLSFSNPVEDRSSQRLNSSQEMDESISQIASHNLKRSGDEVQNPRPLKQRAVEGLKSSKSEASQKEMHSDFQNQANQEQIALQEERVKIARQKYQNLVALSGYTSVDMENVAENIYNDAKNLGLYGSKAVAYMEKELSKRYGIPIGTTTDSLENAYQGHHRDEYISRVIQDALREQQLNDSLERFKQDLDQAEMFLQFLKEPGSEASLSILQTTPQTPAPPQGDALLEMVTDSENVARDAGFEGNIYVQARYLATRLAGADHGDQYEKIYSYYYDAIQMWRQDRQSDKPTQYGFLTLATDLLINGTSTVPVEKEHVSWGKKLLQIIGSVGFGIQIDSSGIQIGTRSNPNLFNVYSPNHSSSTSAPFNPSLVAGNAYPIMATSESSNSESPSERADTPPLLINSSQQNEKISSVDSSSSISQKQPSSQGNLTPSKPSSEKDSHPLPNVDQGGSQQTISNLQDGFSLAGTAQQQLMGHSSLGMVGTTLGAMNEIQEHGFLGGMWNTGVDLLTDAALSQIPGAGPLVTVSSLYHHNLPEEGACSLQQEFYEETKRQNAIESNVFTKEIEYEAGQAVLECQLADQQLRAPSKTVDAINEILHVK